MSRKNLEAAAERFELGLATIVDRMLSDQRAIFVAVSAAFDRVLGPVESYTPRKCFACDAQSIGLHPESYLPACKRHGGIERAPLGADAIAAVTRAPVVRGPQAELPLAKRKGRPNRGK